jgi:hypothetical protein
MMVEEWPCHTCGVVTGFIINGVPYCEEHAFEGIGVQARLAASLRGATGDDLAHAGEWAQEAFAQIMITGHGHDDDD